MRYFREVGEFSCLNFNPSGTLTLKIVAGNPSAQATRIASGRGATLRARYIGSERSGVRILQGVGACGAGTRACRVETHLDPRLRGSSRQVELSGPHLTKARRARQTASPSASSVHRGST